MKQFDDQYIGRLVPGLQRFEAAALIRYYGKLPRGLQVEVHRVQTDIMRTRSGERVAGKQGEFAYATLLQAIAQVRSLERAADARQVLDGQNAGRIAELRSGRVKARKMKTSPTRQTIIKKFLLLIEQLLKQGYSWRQIASYIKCYHRQKISHSYLRSVFLESRGEAS